VRAREVAEYLAIKRYLQQKKSVKPIKAIIRHLPGNTSAEDIAKELLALGFSIISVRQMTSTRPQVSANLPLFLVTLPRSENLRKFLNLPPSITSLSKRRLIGPRLA
jgi:hypothetical protein